jgi:hypothetical protein
MFPVGQGGRETLPQEVAQTSGESGVQLSRRRGGGLVRGVGWIIGFQLRFHCSLPEFVSQSQL